MTKINLNYDGVEDLKRLEGISEEVIERIRFGRFKELFDGLDSLGRIEGVDASLLEMLRKQKVSAEIEDPCVFNEDVDLTPLALYPTDSQDEGISGQELEEPNPLPNLFTGIGIAFQGAGLMLRQEDNKQQKLKEEEKKIKEKKHLINKSNMSIDKEIGSSYFDKPVKKGKKDPVEQARLCIINSLQTLNESGICDEINAQLKKEGLSLRIRMVIWEDDYFLKLTKKSALTAGGNPVTIHLNLTSVLKAQKGALAEGLSHELIHAKEHAYVQAEKPRPYGGHDSDKFKEKEKEFAKKIQDFFKKKSEEIKKNMEDWIKEMGQD